MKPYSNNITIFINLNIPESKIYISRIIYYIKNEIIKRYYNNESKLRKSLINSEISAKIINNFKNEMKLYEENIKNQIYKNELFKTIYEKGNDTLKKLLIEDYLYYLIDKCVEKEVKKNILDMK